MNLDWDTLFMSMVYLVASKSKDDSTHIGAVIVGPDHEVRSVGFNSFPRGIDDNKKERQERPEKYFYFAHAEVNAIYNAARIGVSVKGCTLYTNGMPCTNCAVGIINAGITEVVVDRVWDADNSDKWREEALRSKKMFDESRLYYRSWKDELAYLHKFKNGKVIEF